MNIRRNKGSASVLEILGVALLTAIILPVLFLIGFAVRAIFGTVFLWLVWNYVSGGVLGTMETLTLWQCFQISAALAVAIPTPASVSKS